MLPKALTLQLKKTAKAKHPATSLTEQAVIICLCGAEIRDKNMKRFGCCLHESNSQVGYFHQIYCKQEPKLVYLPPGTRRNPASPCSALTLFLCQLHSP